MLKWFTLIYKIKNAVNVFWFFNNLDENNSKKKNINCIIETYKSVPIKSR